VVSQAGTTFRMGVADMQRLIRDLGYEPRQRIIGITWSIEVISFPACSGRASIFTKEGKADCGRVAVRQRVQSANQLRF